MAHRKKLDLVIAIVDGMTFEEKQLVRTMDAILFEGL